MYCVIFSFESHTIPRESKICPLRSFLMPNAFSMSFQAVEVCFEMIVSFAIPLILGVKNVEL